MDVTSRCRQKSSRWLVGRAAADGPAYRSCTTTGAVWVVPSPSMARHYLMLLLGGWCCACSAFAERGSALPGWCGDGVSREVDFSARW